jgi:serine/threonine protein kinase
LTHPAAIPAQLGRYRLLKPLGQGGMGSVYLAEDTVLRRRVAVKVPLLSKVDGTAVRERFYREARSAAAIRHPNVCPLLDVGEDNGVPFLVMEFIEGKTLSELREAGQPWPVGQAAALVRKLALAVGELHQRGLVHRDLKPSNVMVRPDGEPVLMDFGLARSFTAQSRQLTALGATVGTPAYMAPEQVRGDGKAIGPATDVYALGVILYEVLTGTLPFEGPPVALFGQILHAQPEAPSARRPGLDARLDAICLRAMAKEPGERFASMAALADALTPWAFPVTAVVNSSANSPRLETLSESRFTCRGCGKSLRVPASATGKRLQCPHCRTVLGATSATLDRLAGRETTAPSLLETAAAPPVLRLGPPRTTAGPGRRAALIGGLITLLVSCGTAWLLLDNSTPHEKVAGKQRSPEGSAPRGLKKESQPRSEDAPLPLPESITNSLGMRLVLVKPGRFQMGRTQEENGSGDEKPPHSVEITQPFHMGVHEVTQREYQEVVGKNPSIFTETKVGQDTSCFPVENVTYSEAEEFCRPAAGETSMRSLPLSTSECRSLLSTPRRRTFLITNRIARAP